MQTVRNVACDSLNLNRSAALVSLWKWAVAKLADGAAADDGKGHRAGAARWRRDMTSVAYFPIRTLPFPQAPLPQGGEGIKARARR